MRGSSLGSRSKRSYASDGALCGGLDDGWSCNDGGLDGGWSCNDGGLGGDNDRWQSFPIAPKKAIVMPSIRVKRLNLNID